MCVRTRTLRFTLLLVILALLSSIIPQLTPLSAVQAQETFYPVTMIPVNGMNFGIALSPDNHTAAIYDNGALYNGLPEPARLPIRLIDLTTGEQTGILTGQTDYVADLAFSPDGTELVSYHQNGDVIVRDVASGKLKQTFSLYSPTGGLIEFLPDGKNVLLTTGASPRIFLLMDITTGAITRILGTSIPSRQYFIDTYTQFPGQLELTYATLDIAPDGTQFLTANPNGAVILWEIANNNRFFLTTSDTDNPGRFAISQTLFSPDGSLIAYNHLDEGLIHVLKRTTREEIAVLPAVTLAFAFSPDQQTIAWTDQDAHQIKLTSLDDPENPVVLAEFNPDARTIRNYTTLAFTRDGTRLVLGGLALTDEANAIYVIDLK